MAETVQVKQDGDRSRVAYEMALDLWWETHRGKPNLESKAEFLDLVQECVQSLNGSVRRVS